MPATRSRSSTEQPAAEVAAEEVKQVNEDEGTGDIVGHVPVQEDPVVKQADSAEVPESAEVPAAEEVPAVAAAEPVAAVATNGSSQAAPVEEAATNGSEPVVETNGSAVDTNGDVVADEAAEPVAEAPVSDAKRKSEAGDGDIVPDSTEVKKQKVAEAEPAAESAEPVVEASA